MFEVQRGPELFQPGIRNRLFSRKGALKTLIGWSGPDVFYRMAGPDPELPLWPKYTLEAHRAHIEGAKKQFVLKALFEIGLGIGCLNVVPPLGVTYVVHGAMVFLRELHSLKRAEDYVRKKFSRF